MRGIYHRFVWKRSWYRDLGIRKGAGVVGAVLLTGCTSQLLHYSVDVPAVVLTSRENARIVDARARFRDLFCRFLERDSIAGGTDCSQWLHRLSDEPAAPVAAASTIRSEPTAELLIIPGIFGECFQNLVTVFGDGMINIKHLGYKASVVAVRGRASTEHNAQIIRDHVMRESVDNPDKRFMIIAYSKGTADTMVALRNR